MQQADQICGFLSCGGRGLADDTNRGDISKRAEAFGGHLDLSGLQHIGLWEDTFRQRC